MNAPRQHLLTLLVISSLAILAHNSVSAALVRHYELESITSGTTADSTGNSTGTVNGTAPTIVTGILGDAFNFAGSDANFVDFADPFFGETNITLSYWVNRDTPGRNDGPAGNWNPPSANTTVLTRTSGNQLQSFLRTPSQIGGNTGLTLGTGAFQNVVVTYDGTIFRSYLDGVEGTSYSNAGTVGTGSGTNFVIGGSGSSEYNLDGAVDDLAMWNNALNIAEVKSISNLANTTALNYHAGNAQSLFNVYAESTSSANIGGKIWTKRAAGELTGAPGDIVSLGGGDYGLVLNADGSGVATNMAQRKSYAIDVNSSAAPGATETGFTPIVATYTGNGGSVVIDGVAFAVLSADGSRTRTGPNELTRDFIYDEGEANAAVGLTVSSLNSGVYEAEVWAWDSDVGGGGTQIVGISNLGATTSIDGTPIAGGEIIFTSSFTPDPTEPFRFFFDTSQVAPGFLIFTRENNDGNRARFNALRLTAVPEPSSYVLGLLGALGLAACVWRRRRR